MQWHNYPGYTRRYIYSFSENQLHHYIKCIGTKITQISVIWSHNANTIFFITFLLRTSPPTPPSIVSMSLLWSIKLNVINRSTTPELEKPIHDNKETIRHINNWTRDIKLITPLFSFYLLIFCHVLLFYQK